MMRGMRTVLLVFAAVILVLPSLVGAESNSSRPEPTTSYEKGEVAAKDEVVYAKLSATGDEQEAYVVNIIEVEKAGEIIDYGSYTSLINLTDLSPLEQRADTVMFTAQEGRFYYQGNMKEVPLPWDIAISYFLDGKEIAPEKLAGKDGHLKIRIATSANEEADSVFFENYLLQISLTLNLDVCSNIQAPDGMLANAGKNKQVTFTVMPEKEEELILEADVVNFEMEGINISGVPSSLPIDAPDINNMTHDMKTLTDAIKDVNSGVGELKTGVSALNDGVKTLRDGSEDYKDGISAIDKSSSDLVSASQNIDQALEMLNGSLASSSLEELNLSDLKKLEDGLFGIAGGLREASAGMTILKENYANAYSALDKAIEAIPGNEISEKDIEKLYSSDADPVVLKQLVDTYSAALQAKGTYSAVKKGFDAVESTLEQTSGSLTEMANTLDALASALSSSLGDSDFASSFSQLQQGISSLSTNYKAFHSGLVDYTAGVSQLSGSYSEMHSGIEDLSKGTGELEDGTGQLHNGTGKLHESTSDLPEQMQQKVDEMMSDYDKSDFEAVSFVSPKNEKINSVQFVFKTESINLEESKEVEKPVQEEKGFWARFLDLFFK